MTNKIGILTFHRALSYGALLQSYALQTKLFALGMENELVDYTCPYMVKHYQRLLRPMKGNPVKVLALNLLTAPGIYKERKTRDRFVQKHLKLSPPCHAGNIAQLAQRYPALLAGSDQVWSPTCVGFDPVYFLDFASPAKRYSYAASIGTNTLPDGLHAAYCQRLKDFTALSLREASGAALVQGIANRNDVHVHIDPTLLLTREEWDQLAPACAVKTPYIFLFTVNKPNALIDHALALSRKTGLPLLYLNKLHLRREKEIHYLAPVEADQFVSLIKHAAYVCTNSFHGTAFSALYHKPFVVETTTAATRNTRAEELLSTLGLQQRMLADDISIIDTPTDWSKVDAYLAVQRRRAEEYLLGIRQRIEQGGQK